MTLSVLIPAYNEGRTIVELIRRVREAPLSLTKEIIVVDNGSSDRTEELVRADEGVRYIRLPHNLGKGGALKEGLKHATGDFVIFQDADLEYDPRDFEAMIAPLLAGSADLTLGVRTMTDRNRLRDVSLYYLISWLGSALITLTTNVLYRNNSADYEGCYKACRREVLVGIPVRTNGFDYDNELVCKALKKGLRTLDVPIRYYPRSYEEGKHIRWQDGMRILFTIVRYRFFS